MSSSASSSEEPLDEGDEDEGEGVAHLFMRWLQDQRDERDASLSDELRPAQMVQETDLANDIRVHTGMGRYGVSPVSIATVLGQRAVTGPLSMNRQRLINCLLLPTHPRRVSAGRHGQIFSSKYSPDGTTFAVAAQEGLVTLFDSADWRPIRSVRARDVGWSILDCAYSPDMRFLAYSSWSSSLHLVNATGDVETHDSLSVNEEDRDERFGIFSLQFSHTSTHVVCGASDSRAHLVDLVAGTVTDRFTGHGDDINAVAFCASDANIVFTGSDDCRIGVFDRRVGAHASGWLEGHTEGVTCVQAHPSNAYYLASNSKDQSARLWDIRRAGERSAWHKRNRWDYRSGSLANCNRGAHPNDRSLTTFRSHAVLITLVRCGFSPAITGSRFLYCGSADGRVYIYDVFSGDLICRLTGHQSIVREAAWNPRVPELTSAAFDGRCINWQTRESTERVGRNAVPAGQARERE